MEPRTGVTTATPENAVLAEGQFYVDYGEPGQRSLGATAPGGTFSANRSFVAPEISGVRSKLMGTLYRDRVEPRLTVTLLEMTLANLQALFPGVTTTPSGGHTIVDAEGVGVGDGIQTVYPLANDHVYPDTQRVYVDSVLQVEGVDYTFVDLTGVITFLAGHIPGVGEIITASYVYDPDDGVASYDTLTGGQVETSDHFVNVAWIGNAVDADVAHPVVVIVENPVCIEAAEIEFAGASGGKTLGVQATFEGFASLTSPLDEPWQIRRPRAV